MKKETALIVLIAACLIAFAAGRYSASVSPDAGKSTAPHKIAKSAHSPHVGEASTDAAGMPSVGPADALVTIIEVSDFQCPFCKRVGPTIEKLLKAYPKNVRRMWANNPLSFHNRSKPAAIAAMAAHRQGKFWPYHDKLFANQRSMTEENLKKWAGEIGLDVARWETDLKDPAIVKEIDRQQAAAGATGARGTPGFFINGKLLSGAQPFDAFKREVDAAIASAKRLRKAGKTGLDFSAATYAERDANVGPKVLSYFIKGEKPVAAVPVPRVERKARPTPSKPPRDSYEIWKVPVSVKNDHIMGDNNAALVTIVEFTDFQCPYCARGKKTVDELRKLYGDKIRVVFKHHPLPFHKMAMPAHQAAIAANNQGKFWAFYDKCFDNNRSLNEENLTKWAGELGLDLDKFAKDRKGPATAKRIKDDLELAGTVSVRGTPNFLINGRKLVGAQPLPVFKAIIEEELAKANKAGKKGQAWYEEIIAKGKVFSELDATVHAMDLSKLPYFGDKNAKITFVEFSEFQCPYCSRVGEPLKETLKRFKGKVRVVFAHFPLSFHKFARPASLMACGAWDQGGPETFRKVHDALFASQRQLSEEKIAEIAKANGVDMAKVAANKAKYTKIIDDTIAMGNRIGVRGTPSLYINGRKYEPAGGMNAKVFSATVEKLLAGKL